MVYLLDAKDLLVLAECCSLDSSCAPLVVDPALGGARALEKDGYPGSSIPKSTTADDGLVAGTDGD